MRRSAPFLIAAVLGAVGAYMFLAACATAGQDPERPDRPRSAP